MAQNVVINGVTYSDVPEIDIPKSGGGTAKFYDTAGADASAGDILSGKSAYGASGVVNGNMSNNGAVGGEIDTKAGTVSIPAGYTSGGTVSLKASAVADCQGQYILSGHTILGEAGSLTVPTVSQNSSTKVLTIS